MHPTIDVFGKITIGDYVYIGSNSLLMPGVTVGNNVIIAAGSVVTKSIPDNVVVGGNPVKILCSIDVYLGKNIRYNTCTKGLHSKYKKRSCWHYLMKCLSKSNI